jgi:hypothetical protein
MPFLSKPEKRPTPNALTPEPPHFLLCPDLWEESPNAWVKIALV